MADSETITKHTLSILHSFLKDKAGDAAAAHFESYLHDWTRTWPLLKGWLTTHALSDPKTTILSFAKTIPEYESFRYPLTQSLAIHDEFWIQVFHNLEKAKARLSKSG